MSKKFIIFFPLIYLFTFIKSDCNSTTATSRYDCFEYSTSNKRCCFKELSSACIEVSLSDSYTTSYDCGAKDPVYQEYSFTQYHPTPDVVSDQINFVACGKIKPTKKSDCTKYSQITNSCCFFHSTGGQSCFAIGKKYTGPNKKMNVAGDVTYECNSQFLKISFIFFVFILFI